MPKAPVRKRKTKPDVIVKGYKHNVLVEGSTVDIFRKSDEITVHKGKRRRDKDGEPSVQSMINTIPTRPPVSSEVERARRAIKARLKRELETGKRYTYTGGFFTSEETRRGRIWHKVFKEYGMEIPSPLMGHKKITHQERSAHKYRIEQLELEGKIDLTRRVEFNHDAEFRQAVHNLARLGKEKEARKLVKDYMKFEETAGAALKQINTSLNDLRNIRLDPKLKDKQFNTVLREKRKAFKRLAAAFKLYDKTVKSWGIKPLASAA